MSIAERLRALEPRLRDNYYRLAAIDELKALADEVERLEAVAKAANWAHELWTMGEFAGEETDDAIDAMQQLGKALADANWLHEPDCECYRCVACRRHAD